MNILIAIIVGYILFRVIKGAFGSTDPKSSEAVTRDDGDDFFDRLYPPETRVRDAEDDDDDVWHGRRW